MTTTMKDPVEGVPEGFDYPVGDLLRGERVTLGRSLLDVQRDLRVKAAHIAAIEEMDLDAFANRGVIPGYVRSYARYLGLEPEQVYRLFCAQLGFSAATFGAVPKAGRAGKAPVIGAFRPDFPLAPRRGAGFALPLPPLSAIGSVLALAALVGGLGYGGWTVVRNIQRVQFAPVEESPVAVAEVDDLAAPAASAGAEPDPGDLARPVTATALADLYRDQEASVPILTPRDGPIAAIDPESRGPVPERAGPPVLDTVAAMAPAAVPAGIAAAEPGDTAALIAAAVAANVAGSGAAATPAVAGPGEKLTIVAERAAWIRVYLASGTIVFERILEKGESYSPPEGLTDPKIWAGNSGSVYVRVGDTLRGPLGSGTRAARDVPLVASALTELYPVVEQVPEVVSQSLDTDTALVPTVAIQ
ncbi:helix-turn-helix domain-containing protein [Amaricoccus solimangrovi]|uniref:DUF4115 domain-containing protein n=1 Tax=Amaricoccus solimangrovi TaxID=2589815 RepID=A0A501WXQ0_9RHOB|nr:helix-turn-helix domain-containing protein [Amaricoccus solimangrovi]TPE52954.1 DUF4115 domain-containing protein [Amaricoccus solimangrovi]